VLLIFSSEKPARSYCQDLIKDLKASSPGGLCVSPTVTPGVAPLVVVVPVVVVVMFHADGRGGEYGAPHRERQRRR